MKIDKTNYEAFLLDMQEGRLSKEELAELKLFLEAHPDLGEDLEEFEFLELSAPAVSFEGKEELKHALSHDQEEKIIAYHEGDLSAEEMTALRSDAEQDEGLAKDLAIYSKVFLEADESIVYPNKSGLKKKSGILIRLYPYAAAAAAVALVIFLMRDEVVPDSGNQIMGSTQKVEKVESQDAGNGAPVAENLAEKESQAESLHASEEDKANEKEGTEGKHIEEVKPAPQNLAEEKESSPVEPEIEEEKPKVPDALDIQEEQIADLPKEKEPGESSKPLEEKPKQEVPTAIDPQEHNEDFAEAPKVLKGRVLSRVLDEDPEVTQQMDGHDMASALSGKISEKTGKKISYEATKDENDDVIAYSFNIGKFGIERVRGKK